MPSADPTTMGHADFSFAELAQAYIDCRRTKRGSESALRFEINLERNLIALYEELSADAYTPGRSICFVVTHPRPREVWAAEFRDRIVHHLLYNRIATRFHARFITDSCACIPGRGTLYAANRLASQIRSHTQNWKVPGHYLKCDIANFFVAIDKQILRSLIARYVTEPWWMALAELIIFHDPRENYEFHGDPRRLQHVPKHKRLTEQPAGFGLPIGNLSSQFFANVYLNELDQHVKHTLRARHYVRYVDDFVLLHESPQWLGHAHNDIANFVTAQLGLRLNPRKTILQPIERGVDFVGHVIKPWHTRMRRKTVEHAISRIEHIADAELFDIANSYLGLAGQSDHSHTDRCRIARALMKRGHSIDSGITKTYRRKAK